MKKLLFIAALAISVMLPAQAQGPSKVENLSSYLKVLNSSLGDESSSYASQIAAAADGNTSDRIAIDGNATYLVLSLPDEMKQFSSIVFHYDATMDQYASQVYFFTGDINMSAIETACYVPNGSGVWTSSGSSAVFGTVTKDEAASTLTVENTANTPVKYVLMKGDSGWDPSQFLSITEIDLYCTITEPEVVYWQMNSNWKSTRTHGTVTLNTDDGTMTANAGSDNAARSDIENSTDVYSLGNKHVVFYIAEPTTAGATQQAKDMKLGYTATVPAFSTTAVVNEQQMWSGYQTLEDGTTLVWFDLAGKVADVAYYSGASGSKFDSTTKNAFIQALADDDNLSISVVKLTLICDMASNVTIHAMGAATSKEAILTDLVSRKPVSFWSLNANWKSKRSGGSVAINADGSLTANAGTDNLKRSDIKNEVDAYALGSHKIVFYVAQPTAEDVSIVYNDMKFGFTSTISAYDARPVVCEQVMRKGSETLPDGRTLVWFDLSASNPNTSYFQGDSSNKFDGTAKDAFRAALTASNNLVISGADLVLIGSGNTNITISAMGSGTSINAIREALKQSATVTTTDYGYATFYTSFPAAIPTGVEAYYVTVSGGYALLAEIDGVIPAATGVVLKGTPSTDYTFVETSTTPTTNVSANQMVGYTTDTAITGSSAVSYYAVNYKTVDSAKVPGFFAPKGAGTPNGDFTAKAGKAYLKVNGAASPTIALRFGDATMVESLKCVEGAAIYDLLGRRVAQPERGIYIVNGKKMLFR